jgi:creatinine amidohydrolase
MVFMVPGYLAWRWLVWFLVICPVRIREPLPLVFRVVRGKKEAPILRTSSRFRVSLSRDAAFKPQPKELSIINYQLTINDLRGHDSSSGVILIERKSMPGRPYLLDELTWKTVRDTSYEVAILPWGATEAHNYHLPYSTDVVECDHIAAEAARLAWQQGAKVIVLPTVPFGVNTGQLDIKLTINMNPSTQLAVLNDIAESLARQGIPKLVVMNGHGGNDFRQIIRELLPRRDLFICTLDWFRCLDTSEIFAEAGDHAGELETSLMQLFAPDLVLPLSDAGDGKQRKFKLRALREGWTWTQRDWLRATFDTGSGNPKAATPEKGRRYFEEVTKKIAGFLVELDKADVRDLYE